MAEAAEEKKTGTLVSAGAPQEIKFNRQQNAAAAAPPASNENGGNAGADDKNKNAGGDGNNNAAAATENQNNNDGNNNVPDLTEEQLKAYFAKQGIEFESTASLKEKLTPAPTKVELTDEQKAEQARERGFPKNQPSFK